MTTYQTVKGKIGFFGRIWRLLFWSWQILIALWVIFVLLPTANEFIKTADVDSNIATTIAINSIWELVGGYWLGGSIVLGLFVLFTRPRKIRLVRGE